MRKACLVMAALAVAATCTAASAMEPNWGTMGTSYTNTTGGTVYVLNQPTSWNVTGVSGETVVTLPGAGPDGTDAYYRSGATGGTDDSTKARWNFEGVPLSAIPNVGQSNPPIGTFKAQMYVSDYGSLLHEGSGVFGSANGPWGYHAMGDFSSWNPVPQATPGWTDMGDNTGGYVWLSNNGWSDGVYTDMTVTVKWNPWGGYGGLAVSGVRISTDGNFEVPEPVSALLLLVGAPLLLRRRSA